MGGVLIVFVIFISAKTLGRRGVKSYSACARLFPPPFERGQGRANGAANSSPVKRPVDWAVPDDCAGRLFTLLDELSFRAVGWADDLDSLAGTYGRDSPLDAVEAVVTPLAELGITFAVQHMPGWTNDGGWQDDDVPFRIRGAEREQERHRQRIPKMHGRDCHVDSPRGLRFAKP